MEVTTKENTTGVTWFLKSRALPICLVFAGMSFRVACINTLLTSVSMVDRIWADVIQHTQRTQRNFDQVSFLMLDQLIQHWSSPVLIRALTAGAGVEPGAGVRFGQGRWCWNNIVPALVQPLHWTGADSLFSYTGRTQAQCFLFFFNEHNIIMPILISLYVCFFYLYYMFWNNYCILYFINKIINFSVINFVYNLHDTDISSLK